MLVSHESLGVVADGHRVAMAQHPAQAHMRGLWLLQQASGMCSQSSGNAICHVEATQALTVLCILCATILLMTLMFASFREDKEEQITPLCPQLVISQEQLDFRINLDMQTESMGGNQEEKHDSMTVWDSKDQAQCMIHVDWMDPFRQSAGGVAATVRLQSTQDLTLATVVARNIPVVGQGLALCRTGCEIFGFVEPKGPRRYDVRHRTGVHLLTLIGEFDGVLNIEGINPVGSRVAWFKKAAPDSLECMGHVTQHVDAGLVLCSVFATQVHRRLVEAVGRNQSSTASNWTQSSLQSLVSSTLNTARIDSKQPSGKGEEKPNMSARTEPTTPKSPVKTPKSSRSDPTV